MLSFGLVLSNCQLFAQNVAASGIAAEAPVERIAIEQMQEELRYFRTNLDYLKNTVYRIFGDAKHAEIRADLVTEYNMLLSKFDSYNNFIREVNTYQTYITSEAQKTHMERLAAKYTQRGRSVEQFAVGYALEEGAVLSKVDIGVQELLLTFPSGNGVHYRGDVDAMYKEVEAALNHVEERLNLAENQINRITTGNEEIQSKLLKFLKESGTTTNDVIKYAMKTIPEEDLQFLALVKESEIGKVSKLRMASKYREYLRAIRSRSKDARSSLIRLMRTINPEKLHARAYKQGYENLLNDFPVLPTQKGYKNISKLGRKALKATPLLAMGAVLTAAMIVEVKSDNSFLYNTIGPRKMGEIARKIENDSDELSIAQYEAYYNSKESEQKIDRDVRHLANLINLTIATGKANEDFDIIDNLLVDEEKSLALAGVDLNEIIQNELDEQLANITDIASQYENII